MASVFPEFEDFSTRNRARHLIEMQIGQTHTVNDSLQFEMIGLDRKLY